MMSRLPSAGLALYSPADIPVDGPVVRALCVGPQTQEPAVIALPLEQMTRQTLADEDHVRQTGQLLPKVRA